jgi:hypothetical protein
VGGDEAEQNRQDARDHAGELDRRQVLWVGRNVHVSFYSATAD